MRVHDTVTEQADLIEEGVAMRFWRHERLSIGAMSALVFMIAVSVTSCGGPGGPTTAGEYVLTVQVTGPGTVDPTGGNYAAGTAVNLTATPDANCRLVSWSGTDDDTSTANTNTVTVNADLSRDHVSGARRRAADDVPGTAAVDRDPSDAPPLSPGHVRANVVAKDLIGRPHHAWSAEDRDAANDEIALRWGGAANPVRVCGLPKCHASTKACVPVGSKPKEVARDDHKGDLICTNCGHIIVRTETRAVGKFDVAQHLKRNGKMNFSGLQQVTGASDDKLFGVIQNMLNMGLITDIGGQYSLTKKGQRWYRQRLGQEWGY